MSKLKPVSKTKTYTDIKKKMINHMKQHSGKGKWYAGITNNPERREGEHKDEYSNMKHFKHWYARSKRIANELECFMAEKKVLSILVLRVEQAMMLNTYICLKKHKF